MKYSRTCASRSTRVSRTGNRNSRYRAAWLSRILNFASVERNAKGWVSQDQNPRHADPAQVELPPYYPVTPAVREDWAGYLDAVSGLDALVGRVLTRLAADGLEEDTVVIFFADNGRLEARGLDWCYDSGLHVPLIIRWPDKYPPPLAYHAGAVRDQLVSLIDVTATTLALAGLAKPAAMHGQVFLGPRAEAPRQFVFGARDRADEAVNRIRTVRSERHRYIRNFMPDKPFLAPHAYKEAAFPVYQVLRQFAASGKLTPAQATLTAPRLPDEELYDTQQDPHEINNLVASTEAEHRHVLNVLRKELDRWLEVTDDQGRFPEPAQVVAYWQADAQARHGKNLHRAPEMKENHED